MAEIVNLRMARKRAERRKAADTAAASRRVHGAAKGERIKTKTERDALDRKLDGHRIEPGDRR